ncbi:MAG TPA: MgtC/SapB family protein [Gaiellaceae bacterium]|nr:MgtC/SapB family protein [Gaiellaceae bacterium]
MPSPLPVLSAVEQLSWGNVALRLVVAGALGAAIGLEREWREQEAGLRTHMIVAMGAALFTLVSAFGFHDILSSGGPKVLVRLDPSRIAAQIVSGIGFLGAGAIIRNGLTVRGLTTAASLWLVAAIGMAAGAAFYSAAVVATALTLFALWPLRITVKRFVRGLVPEERRLTLRIREGNSIAPLVDVLGPTRHLSVDGRTVQVELEEVDEALVASLADRDDVEAVEWRR